MNYSEMVKYNRMFAEYWEKRYTDYSLSHLVQDEQWLSRFIDSDAFTESPLSDEVLEMFDLVRNECVRRVAMMSDCSFDYDPPMGKC